MTTAPTATRAVLCLADTKLVLGNVFVTTVFNGRSISDFATLLAIAGTSFGATRALYRWLETQGLQYDWLERGRGPDEIAAMDALDVPPASWCDLMATLYLAEAATREVAARILRHDDPIIAKQLAMLKRDSAFHMSYANGWLKVTSEENVDELRASLRERFPRILRWVQACAPVAAEAFMAACEPLSRLAGIPLPPAAPKAGDWNDDLARAGQLPPRLFEIIRFKDAELLA